MFHVFAKHASRSAARFCAVPFEIDLPARQTPDRKECNHSYAPVFSAFAHSYTRSLRSSAIERTVTPAFSCACALFEKTTRERVHPSPLNPLSFELRKMRLDPLLLTPVAVPVTLSRSEPHSTRVQEPTCEAMDVPRTRCARSKSRPISSPWPKAAS
jgi:hypothetical protein